MIWVSVFFFKQKTAYEMRISDWSSDVCSSDLRKTFQSACRLAMDRSCKELICVPAVNLPLSPPLSPYLSQQQQELSGRQEITSMQRVLLADFFLCDSGCKHRGSALRKQQLAPSPLLTLSVCVPLGSARSRTTPNNSQ